MRSAGLIALLALAACGKPAPAPQPTETAEPAVTATPEPTVEPVATPTEAVATPTPAATVAPEKRLQAVGTEPFWSVEVMPKGRLRYTTPDMINGVVVSTIETHKGEALRFAGRLNHKPFRLDVVPGKCSDGMSDTVYPFTATLLHSGRTDHGCARMK